MPPPAPPSFPYGYTPYPPRYGASAPAVAPTVAGPIYQPSVTHGAPQTPAAPSWKSENGAKLLSEERIYGDSVKRHLDMYDIEAALTDVSETVASFREAAHRVAVEHAPFY